MIKICNICDDDNNINKISKKNLKEIDEYYLLKKKTKFFKNELVIDKNIIKLYIQKNYNQIINIFLGKKYYKRLIFYFAADSSNKNIFNKFPIYYDQNKAYGNFKNFGISKVNKNGYVKFYLKCPVNYLHKKLWYPHVHFLISNYNKTKWLEYLYSKIIICNINFKYLKKAINENDTLILNSSSFSNFIKFNNYNNYNNSFNIPIEFIKKKNYIYILNYIKYLIINYLKNKNLKIYLKKDNNNIFNIPIIIYSFKKEYNNISILTNLLLKFGFKNIKKLII